jgi:hypothetical protein
VGALVPVKRLRQPPRVVVSGEPGCDAAMIPFPLLEMQVSEWRLGRLPLAQRSDSYLNEIASRTR